jgi:sugar lactone lactonase YvrE
MKKSMLLFSIVISIASGAMSQSLNKIWATDTTLKVPESVLLDSKNQRLYVTNIDGKGPWDKDGKGSISLLTLSGKILNPDWIKGLHAPKGMTMFSDFLVVADVDSVVIIEVTKAQIVKKIYVDGAKALNDITSDKRGNMYVSDSKTQKIHFIDVDKLEVSLFAEGLKGVNGLHYVDKTLYFTDAGALYKFGKDKSKMLIAEGMEGGTDGIEQVDENTFLVSCWAGSIWLVKMNGEKKLLLDTQKQGMNTADIGYDKKNKIVYVPTFWKNHVVAYQLQ